MLHSSDLTQGSIARHLLRLTAPLIAGNFLQQLYNTADAFILGRYAGGLEFAAVGVAGAVMNLFIFLIVGASTGLAVIFGELYGAGRLPELRREHWLTFSFGLLTVVLAGALGIPLLPLLLSLMQTPAELTEPVIAYLTVILLTLPAAYLYNLYAALLRAIGNAAPAIYALFAAVTVNIALDLLLVAHFELGIRGAAWATAASQAIAALCCYFYLRHAAPQLLFRREDCRMDRRLLSRTAHFSCVTALHQSSLYIGKLFVQGAVNTGGTDMIAAYTATTRIEGFANSFGDSGSAATSAVIAQNRGAGKWERIRETFRASLLLMLSMGLSMSALMYAGAGASSAFMLGASEGAAYENAARYMEIIAVFYVLCFTGNTFAGYFEGMGRVSVPFLGAAGHITLRVILSWLLVSEMGLPAVALATGIGWALVNLFWEIIRRRSGAGRGN